MVRAHVIFSGTVQGVGFRYTCRSYADDLKLTGWVKNLADGRVELMAEGPRNTVDQLIKSIDRHFDGYIRDKDIDIHDTTGLSFSDFRIAF
jgi:acylphosphatase